MKWTENRQKGEPDFQGLVQEDEIREVGKYHQSLPAYNRTLLVRLDCLAARLGVGDIFIKDESSRFGLNAFKVLGASYAIGKFLSAKLGLKFDGVNPERLKAENTEAKLGKITFATTTDGNHGVGVAWTAHLLGYPAVIYMPKGTTPARLKNIEKHGAKVTVTDMNYDDTVRYVAGLAAKNGWQVVQDTAWEGYEDIPRWIMQGYSTTAREVIEELGGTRPTHVLLQAGVGAFAAMMTALFLQAYPDHPPKIILVEPEKADCFYRSFAAGGKTAVTGDLNTIMAGLACGEPNPVAWRVLSSSADLAVSVPDWVTANGMRTLGNPLGTDQRVVSGESGAVTLGLLTAAAKDEALKQALELDEHSRVILFSTEGDTDPSVYRRVVWDGAYPAEAQ